MDERNDYNSIPMQHTQTAVDWLVNKVYMVIPNSERNFLEGLKEMAKEMEKEQIINAHGLRYSDITEETVNGEDYYNQTYNNENTNGTSIS